MYSTSNDYDYYIIFITCPPNFHNMAQYSFMILYDLRFLLALQIYSHKNGKLSAKITDEKTRI